MRVIIKGLIEFNTTTAQMKPKKGARKKAQRLRAHTALAEDQSSVLNTPVR